MRRLPSPKGTGRAVRPGSRSMGELKYSAIVADHRKQQALPRVEEWLPPRPWRLHQQPDGFFRLVDANGSDIRLTAEVKRLIVERVNGGEPE